jgi:hypothetical protein
MNTSSIVIFVMLSATILVMISSTLASISALAMAADKLKFARQLDEMRSRTEESLRGQIAILERRLETKQNAP